MRRVMLILVAMAVMVSLFAVAAYAAEIQGTEDNEDSSIESKRERQISGRHGDDEIYAGFTTLMTAGIGIRTMWKGIAATT